MKVIKAFEFNDACFTLPVYDGSHQGNVAAWMKVVDQIRWRTPSLYKPLLHRVQCFNEGQTDEIDVVSTLLQENFQFDVQVIWRHTAATLHMFCMVSADRCCSGIPAQSTQVQARPCNQMRRM